MHTAVPSLLCSGDLSFDRRLKLSVRHIDQDRISPSHISGEDQPCGKGLHIFLQISLQRSCSVHRVVSALHDEIFRRIGELNAQFLLYKTFIDVSYQ